MFLTDVPTVDYPGPCTESFSDRLSRLGQGSSSVAYFYNRPDSSTFRYRVLNMIEALSEAGSAISASWFCNDDLCHLEEILERSDILVLCRSQYSVSFSFLVTRARARGKRLLYDIDDLVFDSRYVQLILNTLNRPTEETELDFWFAYSGRNGALMRLCDGVIVTNSYLATCARQFCGLPTVILPNFLNRAQLAHSARILADKRASDFARDGRIHIGYFSGSPTHDNDFAIIEGALLDLMNSDPRIVLRVVGAVALGNRFAAFRDRIEVFPFQNILNLQRLIGEVEINVVPLQDNVFTNCKSELKVFEASAVGTISIASPTFALRHAIQDRETGFMAPAHLWREILALGINQLASYPEMAMSTANAALRYYVPEVQGVEVTRALFGNLVNDPA
ncbi:glycosyltransferase family 1 protein [uncultured Lamprocystis sp.]|jgi:glycosyltransferase involved in cell wall biosynthesis|uniref:glycosyltransferase family 1 protein n=1 Tax=uncultured Lamprocystis sp. TaxID=543132 RepID=UPI0025EBB7A7|nr:glycosyltransferase family 1 protein [uncultured Lamprocystis sp.]